MVHDILYLINYYSLGKNKKKKWNKFEDLSVVIVIIC